ncbi:MAG: quinone-dependent dihydroorotate dehydrogenase [Bacteroidota bacterium]
MYQAFRPLLFQLDAEQAHSAGVSAAKVGQATSPSLLKAMYGYQHPALEQRLFGLRFRNPVCVAAGFDKNAELMSFWDAIGCGYVEVGSVSAKPSDGNPKPRAFRLPADEALINRMGLNNVGAEVAAGRLARANVSIPVGVNIAKTHDPAILGQAGIEDFADSFRKLAPFAGYMAINVSCPNTEEGKTFEDPEALHALLSRLYSEREAVAPRVPMLVKLSPPAGEDVDGPALDALLAVTEAHEVDGYIATNTASDRKGLSTSLVRLNEIGRGGLSGKPLRERSTQLVRALWRRVGARVPVIGVGGIDSADAAYEKVLAGASLLQLYTGLVYQGPGLIKTINRGLVRRLHADGFESIKDAVGARA